MGLYNILLLLVVFGSVPLLVPILNGYNYYYDYFMSEPDPPDTFEFIVGKFLYFKKISRKFHHKINACLL